MIDENNELSKEDEPPKKDVTTSSQAPLFRLEQPYLIKQWLPVPIFNIIQSKNIQREPTCKLVSSENLSILDIIAEYEEECCYHNIQPSLDIKSQIAKADVFQMELFNLNLSNLKLDIPTIQTLKIIFNRFKIIYQVSIRGIELDDGACRTLFRTFARTDNILLLNAGKIRQVGVVGIKSIYYYLYNTKNLQILDLDGTVFTRELVKMISTAAFNFSYIKVINLNKCQINNELLRRFKSALRINQHVQELYLSKNSITSKGCEYVAGIVKNCRALRLIDLSDNSLEDSGLINFIDILTTSEIFWIRRLSLKNTGITISCMDKLINYLNGGYFKLKISLKTLDLGHNNLGDEGLEMLKPTLIKNKSLYQLYLASTNITSKGLITVADILDNNRKLLHVDIRNNPIGNTGIEALSHVLKSTAKTMKIYINSNFKLEEDINKDLNLVIYNEKEECLENIENPYHISNSEYDDEVIAAFGGLPSIHDNHSSLIGSIINAILVPARYLISNIENIVYRSYSNPKPENFIEASISNNRIIDNDGLSNEIKFSNLNMQCTYNMDQQTKKNMVDEFGQTDNSSHKRHRHCQSETLVLTPFIQNIIQEQRHNKRICRIGVISSFEKPRLSETAYKEIFLNSPTVNCLLNK